MIVRERGEKETETLTCCSTYWGIHWLMILIRALTRDQTHNLGILGRHIKFSSNCSFCLSASEKYREQQETDTAAINLHVPACDVVRSFQSVNVIHNIKSLPRLKKRSSPRPSKILLTLTWSAQNRAASQALADCDWLLTPLKKPLSYWRHQLPQSGWSREKRKSRWETPLFLFASAPLPADR